MKLRLRRRARAWVLMAPLAVPLIAAGCATGPAAFEIREPTSIPASSRAFAVIGDLQMTPALVRRLRGREDNREAQRRLIDDLTARADGLDALVIVGDLVFTAGSGAAWRHFDALIGPLAGTLPVLPAIGNHDYHCVFVQICTQRVVPRAFRRRFPWVEPGVPYLVRYDDAALIFLDSETALDDQARWLAATLDELAGDAPVALVFFHRPPFTNSIDRGADGHEAAVRLIVPVLESSPVPAVVFNGHVHGYEHLEIGGIHYFTTAGGGGPRGLLGRDRRTDRYRGRDCMDGPDGAVLRPLNYLVVGIEKAAVRIEMRGYCKRDPNVATLETVEIPLSRE